VSPHAQSISAPVDYCIPPVSRKSPPPVLLLSKSSSEARHRSRCWIGLRVAVPRFDQTGSLDSERLRDGAALSGSALGPPVSRRHPGAGCGSPLEREGVSPYRRPPHHSTIAG